MTAKIRIDQAFSYEPATVADYGFSASKEKGTPCLWVEFVFDNLKGGAGEDVTVRADLWLTENTIDYVLRDLSALGWHGVDLTELDPVSGTYDLKGKRASITGDLEGYNGKMYPKVKFINDINGGGPKASPLDGNELTGINSKLRGKIAAFRAKAAQAPKDNAVYDEKTGKKLF